MALTIVRIEASSPPGVSSFRMSASAPCSPAASSASATYSAATGLIGPSYVATSTVAASAHTPVAPQRTHAARAVHSDATPGASRLIDVSGDATPVS